MVTLMLLKSSRRLSRERAKANGKGESQNYSLKPHSTQRLNYVKASETMFGALASLGNEATEGAKFDEAIR